jgi:hypothetical protein
MNKIKFWYQKFHQKYVFLALGLLLTLVGLLVDLLRGKPFTIGYFQGLVLLSGLVLIIFNLRPRWFVLGGRVIGYTLYALSMFIALSGLLLLLLNIVGLFINTRNPSVYNEPGFDYAGKTRVVQYSLGEVKQQMYQDIGEPLQAYIPRLSDLIFAGTVHYWDTASVEDIRAYNLRVPIYENFILHFKFYNQDYEYCSAEKALERAVVICTQATKIIVDILERQNIPAFGYSLRGHSVAVVQMDAANDVWWIVDSDYGVVVQEDYRMVEQNPEKIIPFYQAAGYKHDVIQNLVAIYGAEDNLDSSFSDVEHCTFQAKAYRDKWMYPAIAVAQFFPLFGFRKWLRKILS